MAADRSPPKSLDRWRTGEPLRAAKLNEAVDAVNRLLGGVRPGRQIVYPKNTDAAASMGLRRFRLIQPKAADTLLANPYSGSVVDNIAVTIACPWELRRTPFDNLTWHGIGFVYESDSRRYATGTSTSEYQVIVPRYDVDDEVWAISVAPQVGGTGVTGVLWQEVFSSRMWVRDNDQTAGA